MLAKLFYENCEYKRLFEKTSNVELWFYYFILFFCGFYIIQTLLVYRLIKWKTMSGVLIIIMYTANVVLLGERFRGSVKFVASVKRPSRQHLFEKHRPQYVVQSTDPEYMLLYEETKNYSSIFLSISLIYALLFLIGLFFTPS